MKKFTLPARVLTGIRSCVGRMSVEEKSKVVDGDMISSIETVDKMVDDVNEANKELLSVINPVEEKIDALVAGSGKRMHELCEGHPVEEHQAIKTKFHAEFQFEVDGLKLGAETKELGEKEVTVELSDEKWSALKSVIRSSVAMWPDSKVYVSTVKAIDEAQDS